MQETSAIELVLWRDQGIERLVASQLDTKEGSTGQWRHIQGIGRLGSATEPSELRHSPARLMVPSSPAVLQVSEHGPHSVSWHEKGAQGWRMHVCVACWQPAQVAAAPLVLRSV